MRLVAVDVDTEATIYAHLLALLVGYPSYPSFIYNNAHPLREERGATEQ